MAPLAAAARAVIDLRKLEDYCLSADHPRGRHKARVFRQALGISREDASWLRDELLRLLPDTDAVELESDRFGTRFRADIAVARQNWSAVVRTLGLSGCANPRRAF